MSDDYSPAASTSNPISPYASAVADLLIEDQKLDEAISRLESRLSVVLHASLVDKTPGETALSVLRDHGEADVVSFLRDRAGSLASARERIDGLVARLDV